MCKYFNAYPMTEPKWLKKSLIKRTQFRKYKKGGFGTRKKDFRAETLFAERNFLLKDDGSSVEANSYNRRKYRRMRRFYPFY